MSIADVLIQRGWFQGDAENQSDGSVCLLGAAAVAYGVKLDDNYRGLPASVEAALYAALPEVDTIVTSRREAVWHWNDTPERTYDEVLRVAKEADEALA